MWQIIPCNALLEQHVLRYIYNFVLLLSCVKYNKIVIVLPCFADDKSRKWNLPYFNNYLLSVDGTGFCVMNLGSKFSLHIYNMKSGLCYEVAIDIL